MAQRIVGLLIFMITDVWMTVRRMDDMDLCRRLRRERGKVDRRAGERKGLCDSTVRVACDPDLDLWRELKHSRYRVLADGREIPAVGAAGVGRMQRWHLFIQHFIAGLQAPVFYFVIQLLRYKMPLW